jgi:hypothetical protein
MATKGFSYAAIPLDNVSEDRETAKAVDRLDLQIAEAAGYHPNLVPQSPRAQAAQAAYNSAASKNDSSNASNPQFVVALEGPDGGSGCIKSTYDRLYGSRPPMPDLYRQLTGQMYADLAQAIQLDTSVVAATHAWSTCMGAGGFAFESPGRARGSFDVTKPITTLEIETAVQDSRCRSSSGIYRAQITAEDAFLRSWTDNHPGVLEQLKGARAADVAAAKAVLGK